MQVGEFMDDLMEGFAEIWRTRWHQNGAIYIISLAWPTP